MRELADCHVHTEACGHASGTVAQMVGAAVFGGLKAIVMTEHLPLPADLDPKGNLAPAPASFSEYAEQVRAIGARVKDLTVVLGAEADWIGGREAEMDAQADVARRAGVEVVLGSVHFLDGWSFDDPSNLSEWEVRDIDAVWERYFSEWCAAARSGRFEVMAHPDLVKKFGHRPSRDAGELYAEAARAASDGGVLIEFSTAGWRKPVAEAYPGGDLLGAFLRAGVGVTVGSDAHEVGEVGYRIADAYEELASAGYRVVTVPLGHGDSREIEL